MTNQIFDSDQFVARQQLDTELLAIDPDALGTEPLSAEDWQSILALVSAFRRRVQAAAQQASVREDALRIVTLEAQADAAARPQP
jgi:hypothetical protein